MDYKKNNFEMCTKLLRKWVKLGPFSIITHKSPPWKMRVTHFYLVASKKLQNLHETPQAIRETTKVKG